MLLLPTPLHLNDAKARREMSNTSRITIGTLSNRIGLRRKTLVSAREIDKLVDRINRHFGLVPEWRSFRLVDDEVWDERIVHISFLKQQAGNLPLIVAQGRLPFQSRLVGQFLPKISARVDLPVSDQRGVVERSKPRISAEPPQGSHRVIAHVNSILSQQLGKAARRCEIELRIGRLGIVALLCRYADRRDVSVQKRQRNHNIAFASANIGSIDLQPLPAVLRRCERAGRNGDRRPQPGSIKMTKEIGKDETRRIALKKMASKKRGGNERVVETVDLRTNRILKSVSGLPPNHARLDLQRMRLVNRRQSHNGTFQLKQRPTSPNHQQA